MNQERIDRGQFYFKQEIELKEAQKEERHKNLNMQHIKNKRNVHSHMKIRVKTEPT